MSFLRNLLNKVPPKPKGFVQRIVDGLEPNVDGGPSGIPGFNRVLDSQGVEIGVMAEGGDPGRDILSKTEAKRQIARTEGLQHAADKDLDAIVKQSVERKPAPAPEHPDAFDYIGV